MILDIESAGQTSANGKLELADAQVSQVSEEAFVQANFTSAHRMLMLTWMLSLAGGFIHSKFVSYTGCCCQSDRCCYNGDTLQGLADASMLCNVWTNLPQMTQLSSVHC